MSGARTALPREDAPPSTVRALGALDVIPPICLAAAASVVGLLAAALAWKPPPAPLDDLTLVGAINVIPEHDVALYLGFGAVFMLVVAGLALRPPRPAETRSLQATYARAAAGVAGAGVAILVAVAAFAHARNRLPAGPRVRASELVMFAALAVTCLMGAWVLSPGRPAPGARLVTAGRAQLRWHRADIIVPLAVVAFLYVPGWRRLAGNAFTGEEFLHIDFFAMGPAMAFRKGVALGTTLHVYYGVGWALLLSRLPLVADVAYGHWIRLEVIYGCVYFIGVYAFLRIFGRSWQWATAGTVLAVLLQLFGSYSSAFVMWRFPSATVLRWAFDIWFFLACLAYLRTRREVWMVIGGLVVGLALLFQTDTGLYLGLGAGFFWLALWRVGTDAWRPLVPSGAAAVAAGVAVLALGLGVASRWTFHTSAFWSGWLENLRLTRAGATLQPLIDLQGRRVLVFFALMMATYLVVAGHAVLGFIHRRLTADAALLGAIAVYGFFTLLYFVGRSNAHNLFRPAVPFAIVVAGAGGLLQAALARRAAAGDSAERPAFMATLQRRLPWVALAVVLVMFAAHPGTRNYPGLARTAVAGSDTDGFCLLENPDDICGIEPEVREFTVPLLQLVDRLRELDAPNREVAIVDSMGPLVYGLADAKPWGRYVPMFPGLFFKDMVNDVIGDLQASPPDIVVMRSRALHNPFLDDMWQAIRPTVEQNYTLDSDFGPFEVWQRRVAGVASGREGTT